MYKKIVVPIDMSHLERADAMIKAARQLGPKAELVLVHAVEIIPSHIMAELPSDLIFEGKKAAKKKLDEIAKTAGDNVKVEILEGHAAAAILDIAESQGADAIVIASHKPGWQDYLIGATAARVVRHAKCTVLVVR